MKMFILRGKAGDYALPGGKSRYWANGALDDDAATNFARLRGYEPRMIAVAGNSGVNSHQMREALKQIRADDDVFALYGFSAGGYTVWNLLNKGLTTKELERLALVVVLGSPSPPGPPVDTYRGDWEFIFRLNPPEGHMAGPRALLKRPYGPD
jgi:pimeloyl-ACP methyl ester carboxylesterase